MLTKVLSMAKKLKAAQKSPRLKRQKLAKRYAPKEKTNPMEVTTKEVAAVNRFKRFLARELKLMGIREKFKVVVLQNPVEFSGNVSKLHALSKLHAEGKLPKGQGIYEAIDKDKKGNGIKHGVGVWKPQRKNMRTVDILYHEVSHAAVASLMKKYGWVIVREGFPAKVIPFGEGLAFSFHLERFAGNRSSINKFLKRYTAKYKKLDQDNDHVLGLELAKAIFNAAPNSPADRRVLREKVAEAGFFRNVHIRNVIEVIKDKKITKKVLKSWKMSA